MDSVTALERKRCVLIIHSGGATPGHARAFALAEIPSPWLSKVVIIN